MSQTIPTQRTNVNRRANSKNRTVNRDYWEQNIEGFSGFYDVKSEEQIRAGRGLAFLYKKFLFPIEKKYMYDRYRYVCEYIDRHVEPGMKVADIGCGSGVFVKRMVARGAFVYALDYAESAVNLTRRNLTADEARSVELIHADITQLKLPEVDVAISIGVLTYIDAIDEFFDNIVSSSRHLLFNYLDGANVLNRLRRRVLPFLDVRDYSYHTSADVQVKLHQRGCEVKKRQRLATGFLIESERVAA